MTSASAPWVALVRRQAGMVTRRQLIDIGVSDDRLTGWKRDGLLRVEGDGVFRMSVVPATPEQLLWRAQLLTGGVLTGAAALSTWGCVDDVGASVLAVIPAQRHLVAPRGIRLLRRDLRASDVTLRHGLSVTTRGYSVLEHLVALPFVDAVPFADRALAQRWFTDCDVERRLSTPLAGNRGLRRVLAVVERGVESEAERRLVRLLRAAEITGWKPNRNVVQGHRFLGRSDIVFEDFRLVLEVNGFAHHSRRGPFRQDMRRHNDFALSPWMTLRFGWDDIVGNPEYVIRTVRAALAERRATLTEHPAA